MEMCHWPVIYFRLFEFSLIWRCVTGRSSISDYSNSVSYGDVSLAGHLFQTIRIQSHMEMCHWPVIYFRFVFFYLCLIENVKQDVFQTISKPKNLLDKRYLSVSFREWSSPPLYEFGQLTFGKFSKGNTLVSPTYEELICKTTFHPLWLILKKKLHSSESMVNYFPLMVLSQFL